MNKTIRDGFGDALLALASYGKLPLVFDADLSGPSKTAGFAKAFPKSFWNNGVAEADMIGMAHGAAYCFRRQNPNSPRLVVASTFASMMQMVIRRIEMLSMDKMYVLLHGSHGGLVGGDGASHDGVRTIPMMLTIPNLTVLWPADYQQAYDLVMEIANRGYGTYYLQTGRGEEPVFTDSGEFPKTKIGKIQFIRYGADLTLCACGPMVYPCIEAVNHLQSEGYQVGVINVHTLKPLDLDYLREVGQGCNALLVVEEQTAIGGLHAVISRALISPNLVPNFGVHSLALTDEFDPAASVSTLRELYGLNIAGIIDKVRSILPSN